MDDSKYEECKNLIGYKLFRIRKDGSIGPLFINRKLRIQLDKMYYAEDHPTRGYAHRPGWHICSRRSAPHLSKRGRKWFKVYFEDYEEIKRPRKQGGLWYLAKRMKVIGE